MAKKLVTFDESLEESEVITLNIRKRDFGEFLQNLLGEPRTTEKHYNDSFVIDLNWISNLDSVVTQRVSQNSSQLVDFRCKIYFESGVIKTLTSREAMLSFADNSNDRSVGIQITWIFLIQFPHSSVPERQAIRFRAFSNINFLYATEPPSKHSSQQDESRIRISIENTELTWGEDVFSHLNNLIERTAIKPTKLHLLSLKTTALLASGYTMIAYLIIVIIVLYLGARSEYFKKIGELQRAMEGVDASGSQLDVISSKLDLYARYMHFESSGVFMLALFKLIAFFILLGFAVAISGKLVTISAGKPFVILNAATKTRYDEYKSKSDVIVVAVVIGFIINVLAGIFLNNLVPIGLNLLTWVHEKTF